jgi:hypothetical protein
MSWDLGRDQVIGRCLHPDRRSGVLLEPLPREKMKRRYWEITGPASPLSPRPRVGGRIRPRFPDVMGEMVAAAAAAGLGVP